jgi:hypothetical protein
MSSSEAYDFKAEAFRLFTGQMAPGKDAPAASYALSIEERTKMWNDWHREHAKIIRCFEMAFERITESD